MAHDITFGKYYCYTPIFVINGVDAIYDDFGIKEDIDSDHDGEYVCGNMHFTPLPPRLDILEKYKIDELEYWTIANKLEDGLSFGTCGLCI